ncbi:hypothetical protein ABFS82_08G059300 [Erythranthe guttata]|nr:PREDICTED: uncharacterized protein LOC105975814 [Erythranthe guttata]XP_012856512.1 PREDICTED: uncharacterized protein LOC105975814 [Erythranthe guttata]|eukprot:XP_012856504.1 PREDICTED: uncharacterized protein LOC105975814 [Erythranthe guttata]
MGNCQAAEAATVVIQHGGNRVERIYWSLSADEVMNSNPGHYVALVVASPAARTENGTTVKQLKLLRPDDTLLLGQVYRLVSFEEVMKEFAAKKCAKLGKLLKLRGAFNLDHTNKNQNLNSNSSSSNGGSTKTDVHRHVGRRQSGGGRGRGGVGRHSGGGGGGGGGQWRPALQTITELGI